MGKLSGSLPAPQRSGRADSLCGDCTKCRDQNQEWHTLPESIRGGKRSRTDGPVTCLCELRGRRFGEKVGEPEPSARGFTPTLDYCQERGSGCGLDAARPLVLRCKNIELSTQISHRKDRRERKAVRDRIFSHAGPGKTVPSPKTCCP